jgi:putative ABC transport system substrate-binding protein
MRRREFISLLGSTVVAWPLAAIAQNSDRIRLIGMLTAIDDPELKAFHEELEKRGWSEGHNIHIEYRLAPAAAKAQTLAKELVAMQPDVIFVVGRPTATALHQESRTIPIVFTYVIDPIGAGFVASLARPGGNLTGLMAYDPSTVGKWLGMLKEIAPQITRVGLLGNPKTAAYFDYLLGAAQAVAPSLGIEAVPSHIENDPADIERAIAAIAGMPNSGIVVVPEATTTTNRDLIIMLTARNRLPAIYNFKHFVPAGGLISYGIVSADHYRQGAFYVDRILRGAKPAELPVQAPTKYETAVNLKTAETLGLTVPAALLVAADEVVE